MYCPECSSVYYDYMNVESYKQEKENMKNNYIHSLTSL